jgi:hypothetical protein
MYNTDTELMFPLRVIPTLVSLRGEPWRQLISQLAEEQADLTGQAAFVLMIMRLSGCVGCNADSFRAMRGCTQCARLAVKRFRGSDQAFVDLFQQTRQEVDVFSSRSDNPEIIGPTI